MCDSKHFQVHSWLTPFIRPRKVCRGFCWLVFLPIESTWLGDYPVLGTTQLQCLCISKSVQGRGGDTLQVCLVVYSVLSEGWSHCTFQSTVTSSSINGFGWAAPSRRQRIYLIVDYHYGYLRSTPLGKLCTNARA